MLLRRHTSEARLKDWPRCSEWVYTLLLFWPVVHAFAQLIFTFGFNNQTNREVKLSFGLQTGE